MSNKLENECDFVPMGRIKDRSPLRYISRISSNDQKVNKFPGSDLSLKNVQTLKFLAKPSFEF